MLVVSLLLLTLWLGGLVVDVTMGGFIHLLAVGAVAIILTHDDHRVRHSTPGFGSAGTPMETRVESIPLAGPNTADREAVAA